MQGTSRCTLYQCITVKQEVKWLHGYNNIISLKVIIFLLLIILAAEKGGCAIRMQCRGDCFRNEIFTWSTIISLVMKSYFFDKKDNLFDNFTIRKNFWASDWGRALRHPYAEQRESFTNEIFTWFKLSRPVTLVTHSKIVLDDLKGLKRFR